MTRNLLTYSEMIRRSSFSDRFEYLNLHGVVSELTFGSNRYLNQMLYHLGEWRSFRRDIILRDNGCDLAVLGREINGPIIVHHINPITVEMVIDHDPLVLDPDNVVCVSRLTHNAIHYGSLSGTYQDYEPRKPNDTCPWK